MLAHLKRCNERNIRNFSMSVKKFAKWLRLQSHQSAHKCPQTFKAIRLHGVDFGSKRWPPFFNPFWTHGATWSETFQLLTSEPLSYTSQRTFSSLALSNSSGVVGRTVFYIIMSPPFYLRLTSSDMNELGGNFLRHHLGQSADKSFIRTLFSDIKKIVIISIKDEQQ